MTKLQFAQLFTKFSKPSKYKVTFAVLWVKLPPCLLPV